MTISQNGRGRNRPYYYQFFRSRGVKFVDVAFAIGEPVPSVTSYFNGYYQASKKVVAKLEKLVAQVLEHEAHGREVDEWFDE